jgi:DNA-directed RNA polymerase specialized sigma24 family protein
MNAPLAVTSEALAAYQDMCGLLARRYTGLFAAEYDDLFQEGWLECLLALRKGQRPSKDIVAKRMTAWVSRCANNWMGVEDDALLN